MYSTKPACSGVIVALGLLLATNGHAFDLGNIMDPSRWVGGGNDYYDDYPGGSGYGYPGELMPGYGYGGLPAYGGLPGYGYGGFPDYHYGGIPGYGGLPGLGGDSRYDYYGNNPGYGYQTVPGQDMAESPEAAEIRRLKERIRKLEEASDQAAPAWSDHPGYPADSSPWGTQPGYPEASKPWNSQPSFPEAGTPWEPQPGYPATTVPWGAQPGVQSR